MEDLGNFLLVRRKLKGYSIRELASLAKVSTGLINKLENNKAKQPNPVTLNKIAKVLDIENNVILELAGYKLPDENRLRLEDCLQRLGLKEEKIKHVMSYIGFVMSRE